MTDKDLLQAISDIIDKKLEPIKKDIADIRSDISDIKLKVDVIDTKVDRNYNITLDFYGNQKEHNTEASDTLDTITGQLEMHNNQIAKNTAVLKRCK